MSWLRWVSTAFMVVCLLSFLTLVVCSDATMRLHIKHLLGYSAVKFLGSQGTTALGFLTPFAASAFGAIATTALLYKVKGWNAIRQHWGQTTIILIAGTLIGNISWLAPAFAWPLVKTIEADHQSQVEFSHKYKTANIALRGDLERRKQNLQPSDPAFHNMLDTIQVFMRYRENIGRPPAANCRILITGPQQGASSFESATLIEGLLMTFAVIGANCPNGNLLNIGIKPENAERESLKGIVPGKINIHAHPGAKGVDQLVDSLGNLIQTTRSYTMPTTPENIPENTIWLQIGPGTKWNSELR